MSKWVIWVIGLMAICGGLVEEHELEMALDYKDALTKSLIFLEAQRSGPLPPNHRPAWRGDSALDDGKLANVDLVGGYYDAGDNVKYGLPQAFTVTTLAWAVIAYRKELEAAGELENTIAAVRWGTDYFLKAACATPGVLYVQVGDPLKDHECWINPENMKTPRTVLSISAETPGSEIAAETAAALAASYIVFNCTDLPYATRLLDTAKSLYTMAKANQGTFKGECPFYCSFSGYRDEMMWAATWMYMATCEEEYIKSAIDDNTNNPVAEFSWDLKFAGAQIILSELFYQGRTELQGMKTQAECFICTVIPDSPTRTVTYTPGGMIYLRDGANSQYVTGTAMLLSVYSDFLAKYNQTMHCGDKEYTSNQLMAISKSQMDYLLGKNPLGRSMMVGFGKDPPTQAHHRGASCTLKPGEEMECGMTFARFFNVPGPNPHELTGAILGGPDKDDKFEDLRTKSCYTEPCTYVNSQAVGVLAKLAANPNAFMPSSAPNIPLPGALPTPEIPIPGALPTPNIPLPGALPTPNIPLPDAFPTPEIPLPGALPTPNIPLPSALPTPNIPLPGAVPTPDIPLPGALPTPNLPLPGALPTPNIPLR